MYHFKHMRTKLILAVGLPMLVLFIIMAISEFRAGAKTSVDTIQAHLQASTESSAMRLNQMFVKNAQIAQNNASFYHAFPGLLTTQNRFQGTIQILKTAIDEPGENPEVFGMTVAMIPTPDMPSYESNHDGDGFTRPETSPYVWRDLKNPTQIGETDLVNQEGIYYPIGHWKELKWYTEPFRTHQTYWSDPYIDPTPGLEDVEMITCSIPFQIENKLRGICTVDISLSKIRELLDKGKPPIGYQILVSPNGDMLYHPNFTKVAKIDQIKSAGSGYGQTLPQKELDSIMEQVKKKEAGFLKIFCEENKQYAYWVVCQPLPETGWTLIQIASETDVLAPVFKSFRRQTLVFLFILLTTLIILSIVSSMVTRPLEKIDVAAEKIITGDFSVRVDDVAANDEAGRLAKTFNHMLETLKTTVDQKAQESAARRTIENDVSRARDIQARMLPDPKSMSFQTDFDIYALNLPARFVAGDFYDFWMLDNQTLALVVADVSGKGTPAAMFMAMSRTILRGVASAKRTPAEILKKMNDILNHANDQMFVTIFYAHYNIKTGQLVYANGGHLPPVIRRNSGLIEECPLPFGFPVGIIPDTRFEQNEMTIAKGESLCIYTDGVSEATAESASGEKTLFGSQRIVSFIEQEGNVSPEQLCFDLARVADSFRKSERQDDITVLTIKRK